MLRGLDGCIRCLRHGKPVRLYKAQVQVSGLDSDSHTTDNYALSTWSTAWKERLISFLLWKRSKNRWRISHERSPLMVGFVHFLHDETYPLLSTRVWALHAFVRVDVFLEVVR